VHRGCVQKALVDFASPPHLALAWEVAPVVAGGEAKSTGACSCELSLVQINQAVWREPMHGSLVAMCA